MLDGNMALPIEMELDEATLERYADWLDEMEKSDPESYRSLMATMQSQLQGGGTDQQSDSSGQSVEEKIMNKLRSASDTSPSTTDDAFMPHFPGNKEMGNNGLQAKQEGMYIDVDPGFVVKSTNISTKEKVFLNVCTSGYIQTFSEKKKLDEHGKEQDGLHIPLSLGPPHSVKDKSGMDCTAFDVAVNPDVVKDCQQDTTGSFRHFVCQLAIQYVEEKHTIELDPRYKLPNLKYRGDLPPPKHYIRKTQTPQIQEVNSTVKQPVVKKKDKKEKTLLAAYTVQIEDENGLEACNRKHPIDDIQSPSLSKQILQSVGDVLHICISFKSDIRTSDQVGMTIQPELVTIDADSHHTQYIWLPYPIDPSSTTASIVTSRNEMKLSFHIDKAWDSDGPDIGSSPWLLSHALHDDTAPPSENQKPLPPKTLAERFHLVSPSPFHSQATSTREMKEEELAEDRFHQRDMMSMHILEQRKLEKEQKEKEADENRQKNRKEVEEKKRKAEEAGKTWQEMYPQEPEVNYIDFGEDKQEEVVEEIAGKSSEDAKEAALAWREAREGGLDLETALAFELLE